MSCKGCYADNVMSIHDVKLLVEEQLALETDLVDDAVYKERVASCMTCPSLLNQTTCSLCGCFIHFRAKIAYKHCPHPTDFKW
ncbi:MULTISPECIES: DUF6171 family protein [Virgibacillus]|uniref:Uncharacterized protein n=1 Tax=Virgibacillus massiliensis TaxID=1462526 RepID=A0A024Q7D1_9BACI|nr:MULTISPECIES: DUF6171 family protein [Virgibacillus]EQB38065.1 hypothetical protein M948_05700 [Virgibacillus sp. CM-4]MYL40782.1 hypothetical protein [Virgibacillus massiliensis]CDQ38423.1 hypothetical protein BN990_00693 [Virgibacillus massiliensis]